MKRFIISLIIIMIILLFAIINNNVFKKVKKEILRVNNYLKIYNAYVGKKEELQEISGEYMEKTEYNKGYLIHNTSSVTSLSKGTIMFKGTMEDKKTIIVMNEYATYKYQNIDEYKCHLYQAVKAGDIIASNNGTTYYEVAYED